MAEEEIFNIFIDFNGTLDMHKDPVVTLAQMRSSLAEKGFPNIQFYILSSQGAEDVEEYIRNTKLESQITGYASSGNFKRTLSSPSQKVTLVTDLTQEAFLNAPNFNTILIDNEPIVINGETSIGNPKHLRFGAAKYENISGVCEQATGIGCEDIFDNLFFVHFKQDRSLVGYVDIIAEKLQGIRFINDTEELAERPTVEPLTPTRFPSPEVPAPETEQPPTRRIKAIGE